MVVRRDMKKWLTAPVLIGKKVHLHPTVRDHEIGLLDAAADGNLHDIWYTSVPSDNTIQAYLDFAFSEQEEGRALIFTVLDGTTGKILGSTRYCNATPEHRRVEIGYTWYAKSA